jgi:hypothetical protein
MTGWIASQYFRIACREVLVMELIHGEIGEVFPDISR